MPLPTDTIPPAPAFPIVGLGASAGGLAAFEAFFSGLPDGAGPGMAFVLVQHLAPDHESLLTAIIARCTRLQVFEVQDGMRVAPDCAYIIPPNRELSLVGGVLHLREAPTPHGVRQPIDAFFRSLATDLGEKAICVVLSGTGSDGSLGARAVKEAGGLAMAQSPESAAFDGMPRAAIATGLMDCVLAPAQMPAQLAAWAAQAAAARSSAPSADDGAVLKLVCALLAERTGHDFSQYKPTTLVRRIGRRMAVHHLRRLGDYLRFLRDTPPEAQALFRDLLIGVTSFFRDTEAFATLEAQVVPGLFEGHLDDTPVRVWVCGCSTGEEAYSVAMLLLEHQQRRASAVRVQIFATDVDPHAVARARAGLYPAEAAAALSLERQARHFEPTTPGGALRIKKAVRELIVFSEQDVIKDPPFSRMDLICCRNLLIYLDAALQQTVIPLFHYALNPGGVLFLGSSETVGPFADHFTVIDRHQKLYRRRADAPGHHRAAPGRFVPPDMGPRPAPAGHRAAGVSGRSDLALLAERTLLAHHGAVGVLVDRRGDVLHVHGRTGPFLEQPEGSPTLNVLALARGGLQPELTAALHAAATSHQTVRREGVHLRGDGEGVSVTLVVHPVPAPPAQGQAELYLVVFQATAAEPVPPPAPGVAAPPRVVALEQALQDKEAYLQATLTLMETSHADLESTNEEMQSVNEELQSTNEEMETSKEELQAVNEELATVNAELHARVTELSRANNDMNNLLAGTGVATVFVDLGLRIVRFTPTATELINLIPGDLGRPVAHVASNLLGEVHLLDDLAAVLADLQPREAEVQTRAGRWFLMRVRPYRTQENAVEGAVITFTDITRSKEAELGLTARGLDAASGAMFDGFLLLDAPLDARGRAGDFRVRDANEAFTRLTGLTGSQVKGRPLIEAWPAAGTDWLDTLALVAERGVARRFELPAGASPTPLRGSAFRPLEGSPRLGIILTGAAPPPAHLRASP